MPFSPPSPQRLLLLLAIPVATAVALLALRVRRRRRAARANQRALQLLRAGDLVAAAEVFQVLAQARHVGAMVKGMATYNLAFVLLRQGELRAAAEALSPWETRGPKPLRPLVASLSSLCLALLGELDEADRRAADARAAASTTQVRLHVAAAAIASLRRGDARAAREAFEQGWPEIERGCPGELVRGLRLPYALAAEAEGGAAAALATGLLAGARPFRAGEYAWLAAHWPELARYLEAKGFVERA